MNCKYLLFVFLISLIGSIKSDLYEEYEEDNRQLVISLNPGCPKDQCQPSKKASDLNIYHVTSSEIRNKIKYGEDLHFVLSTYGGSPAFFIARTKNDSKEFFDWTKLKNNEPDSISFVRPDTKPDKQDTVGVLISRLFKWVDSDDSGAFKPGVSMEEDIDLNSLHWDSAKVLDQSKSNLHIEYNLKESVSGGTITVRLMVTSTLKKYVDNPSLLFTSRSVHCQLVVNGFQDLLPHNTTARLGMELTLVTTGQDYKLIPLSDIDDEYSPGIFKSLKYQFGESVVDHSFLAFKPNAYTTAERSIAQTIDSKQSKMNEQKSREPLTLNNAFNGFYASDLSRKLWTMNVTFGGGGQNFYTKTNHTEFSFVIGLDTLPEPKMSLFIELIIIIGSGLSLLVLMIFPISICLMARKMRKRHEREGLLNNQDSIY